MKLKLILLLMLAINLAGCATQKPTSCIAISPSDLEFIESSEGVTIPLSDFSQLLIYIEQLERCAEISSGAF